MVNIVDEKELKGERWTTLRLRIITIYLKNLLCVDEAPALLCMVQVQPQASVVLASHLRPGLRAEGAHVVWRRVPWRPRPILAPAIKRC